MHDAASGEREAPDSQRRSRRVATAIAALLLIGGAAAIAVAVANQDSNPPRPPIAGVGTLSHDPNPRVTTTDTGAAASTETGAPTVSRPVHIRLPTIGVSSPLTVVGLQHDGMLEVPEPGPDYDKAAWFNGSPRPGEVGPAVIEGHVDGAINGPSVFYRLGDLRPGDQVVVAPRAGRVVRFEVYAIRLFPKSDFPTLKVYGNTSRSELRLITCGGPFDPNRSEGGYTDNVVVFAAKV
ncbi:MAG: class F sortase [Candidatus Nanopelagicales bacterium]